MARHHFGGSPWDVVQTVTGDVVPSWLVTVYAPGDLVNPVTDLLEADSDLPITELRTNPADHESPGLIRRFRGPDGLSELVYVINGPDGRTHTWHEPAHEIAGAVEVADDAKATADAAFLAASTALATSEQASQAADIARLRSLDAELAAQQAQAGAAAYISSISPAAAVTDLAPTVYVPWRGGANIAPENTLEALDQSVASGFTAVHVTARRTVDNALFCFDSGSPSELTNMGGLPGELSSAGILRGRYKADDWFCNTWPGDLRVVLLSQMIARAQKRTVLIVQLMDAGSVPAAVQLILRMKAETYVILMSTERTALRDVAVPWGIHSCLLDTNPASTNHALVMADGIRYYALDISQSVSHISNATSQGLKVFSLGAERAHQRDALPNDVFGVITADPVYLDPDREHRVSTDPHGSGTFYHGHQGLANGFNAANAETGVRRGYFPNPTAGGSARQFQLRGQTNEPGYTSSFQSVLMGWMNPRPDPTDWTLTGTVQFNSWVDANSWVGFEICRPTDRPFNNNARTADDQGYLVILRQSGQMVLYRHDGTTQTQLSSTSGSALTANDTRAFTLDVRPDGMTLTFGSSTLNSGDTTYRGPYSLYAVNGVNARFYNMAVS